MGAVNVFIHKEGLVSGVSVISFQRVVAQSESVIQRMHGNDRSPSNLRNRGTVKGVCSDKDWTAIATHFAERTYFDCIIVDAKNVPGGKTKQTSGKRSRNALSTFHKKRL